MDFSRKPYDGKNIAYQKTSQNGTPPIARLQQKVAHLEISLRDKETELAKLHGSTKATVVNELKIQTEMYFQEVLRLRNQLNLLQEPLLHQRLSPIQEPLNELGSSNKFLKKAGVRKEHDVSTDEEKIRESFEKLKDENCKLHAKLSFVQAEKDKLAEQFEEVIKQADEKMNRSTSSLTEEATQTSPKHDAVTLSPPPPHFCETTEGSLSILKSQIEDLQGREKTWEEERANYKELVTNLKEDRVFYKDVSLKKQEELGALQSEMVKLHKEVLRLQKEIAVFNLNGKPLCSHCIKSNFRISKSSKKPEVESPTNVSKESSHISSKPPPGVKSAKSKSKSPSRSSRCLPQSPKDAKISTSSRTESKSSSSPPVHSKRMGKSLDRNDKITRSNAVATSGSSSDSNSVKSSPSHSIKKASSVSPKMSGSISESVSSRRSSGQTSSESSRQSSPAKKQTSPSSSTKRSSQSKLISPSSDVHKKVLSASSKSADNAKLSLSRSPSKSRPSPSKSSVSSNSPHAHLKSPQLTSSQPSTVLSPQSSSKSFQASGKSGTKSDRSTTSKTPCSAVANSSASSTKRDNSPSKSSLSSSQSAPLKNSEKSHELSSQSPVKSLVNSHQSSVRVSQSKKLASKSSAKSVSTSSASNSTLEKVTSLERDDENLACVVSPKSSLEEDKEIAREILSGLDASGLGDSVNKKYLESYSNTPSVNNKSQNSGAEKESVIPATISIENAVTEDSKSPEIASEAPSLHIEVTGKEDKVELESLLTVLEAHTARKSKFQEIQPKTKVKVVSPSKRRKLQRKKTVRESPSVSSDHSIETEIEIEGMMSILEAHVTRKAFLALMQEQSLNCTGELD